MAGLHCCRVLPRSVVRIYAYESGSAGCIIEPEPIYIDVMPDLTIAMIIFNRPRHTAQSFECIQAQQPKKLFIIADGPRLDQPCDLQKCEDARAIVAQIDWPC